MKEAYLIGEFCFKEWLIPNGSIYDLIEIMRFIRSHLYFNFLAQSACYVSSNHISNVTN